MPDSHSAGSEHKPPLGMVPYLPSHSHDAAVPCQEFCPVWEWERHVGRYGNPYDQPRPKSLQVTVTVADAPEVVAAMEQARNAIEGLERERDEWEDRYDVLLSRCGGTMP